MTLPGDSSFPAEYKEKLDECDSVGPALRNLIEKNILPRDIMTRTAFENAMVRVRSNCESFHHFDLVVWCPLQVLTMILGGSTNAVLHLIAIAHSVGINLTIDDFQSVSDRVPFIADLKPSGKYVMEDVHKIGGIPGSLPPLTLRLIFRTNPHPFCWKTSSFFVVWFLGLSAFVSIIPGLFRFFPSDRFNTLF